MMYLTRVEMAQFSNQIIISHKTISLSIMHSTRAKCVVYSPGGKLCKRMVEQSPVKMKVVPGPDAENICCHLNVITSPTYLSECL